MTCWTISTLWINLSILHWGRCSVTNCCSGLDPSSGKAGCVTEKHFTAHFQALIPREIPTTGSTGITTQFSGFDWLELGVFLIYPFPLAPDQHCDLQTDIPGEYRSIRISYLHPQNSSSLPPPIQRFFSYHNKYKIHIEAASFLTNMIL